MAAQNLNHPMVGSFLDSWWASTRQKGDSDANVLYVQDSVIGPCHDHTQYASGAGNATWIGTYGRMGVPANETWAIIMGPMYGFSSYGWLVSEEGMKGLNGNSNSVNFRTGSVQLNCGPQDIYLHPLFACFSCDHNGTYDAIRVNLDNGKYYLASGNTGALGTGGNNFGVLTAGCDWSNNAFSTFRMACFAKGTKRISKNDLLDWGTQRPWSLWYPDSVL